MSLIYIQVAKSLKTKESIDNTKVNPTFKHFLKCKSCLWKITFYESTGNSISINSKKIRCPVCKEKEMNFTKIKIIS